MRILGLDIGTKTIGVAVSDELSLTAQGLFTLKRKGLQSDIRELEKLIEERSVERIVIGLPKNMNNTLGTSANMVFPLSKSLQKVLIFPLSPGMNDFRPLPLRRLYWKQI